MENNLINDEKVNTYSLYQGMPILHLFTFQTPILFKIEYY